MGKYDPFQLQSVNSKMHLKIYIFRQLIVNFFLNLLLKAIIPENIILSTYGFIEILPMLP